MLDSPNVSDVGWIDNDLRLVATNVVGEHLVGVDRSLIDEPSFKAREESFALREPSS